MSQEDHPAPVPTDPNEKMPEWLGEHPYCWKVDDEKLEGFKQEYENSCYCGAVGFAFSSGPLGVKFCHCEDCRIIHGAPYQQTAIFPRANLRLLRGPEFLAFTKFTTPEEVRKNPRSRTPPSVPRKVSCIRCGSPLMDEGNNMAMCYPAAFKFEGQDAETHDATINAVPTQWRASNHIFYGSRTVDVPDGLPKWEGHKNVSRLMVECD